MVEINIKDGDDGQRLNKFLMKYLNEAPSSFIYKMLRKKNIVLNDKKAKGDEILANGDILKLYLSDDTISNFRGKSKTKDKQDSAVAKKTGTRDLSQYLNILYEDKDIIAVHKDVGILSQKATIKDYSINEAIVDYINNNDKYLHSETFKPSVCNRLDKNTSGIILAGITLKGSQYLSRVLKDRSLDKYYYTLVKGEVGRQMTCQAYINKDHKNNVSKVISSQEYEQLKLKKGFNSKDYSCIKTEFIPISTNKDNTLLKVKLITGKSHQIRAHLKFLGYPMAGDIKYGDKFYNSYMKEKYNLSTHLLHAGIVELNEDVIIKDPLPEIFIKICKGEGLDYSKII